MSPSEFRKRLKNAFVASDFTVREPIILHSLLFKERIELDRFTFEDLVDFEDCRFAMLVQFTSCIFAKGLVLRHARFEGPLTLSRCEILQGGIGPPADFRNLHVEGEIDFRRLHVRGDLEMPDLCCGAGLLLNGAQIDGGIIAESAFITSALDLGEANDATVDGSENVTRVKGSLNLSQSSIGSQVTLTTAKVGAVNLEQSKIGGTIFCYFTEFALTLLHDPTRQQPLPITSSELGSAQDEDVLKEDRSETPVLGSLTLFGATVNGNVELKKAALISGLNLSSAEIRGNLIIKNSTLGKSETSSVRMVGAEIRGAAQFVQALFTGRLEATNCSVGVLELDEQTLENLRQLKEALAFEQRTTPAKRTEDAFPLDLTGTTYGDLGLPEGVTSKISPGSLYKPWSWKWTKRTRKKVLTDNVYAQMLELTKLDERSYRGVENWLRRQGYDYAADSIFLRASSRRIHEIKSVKARWWKLRWLNLQRWWNCTWLHVLGWGLIRRWLAIGLAVSFATTFIFCKEASIRNPKIEAGAKFNSAIDQAINDRGLPSNGIAFIAPTLALEPLQPQTTDSRENTSNDSFWSLVLLAKRASSDGAPPRSWGDHGWVMFRTAFPMLAGVAPKNWEPSRNRILGIRYESIAAIVSTVSWIFLPLLIASFAGLLKRRNA